MRRIVKSKPGPAGLLQLRRQGMRYDDLDQGKDNARVKDQVRQALLSDQKRLCCYCMRSIDPEKHHVRIEHHESQSSAPHRDLDWDNLLAACSGSSRLRGRAKDDGAARKVPRSRQTCDNRKGNQAVAINPLTKNVEAIRYLSDGRIEHPQAQLQEDIEERLNLNVDFLVRGRRDARDELIERLQRELGPHKSWTAESLTRVLVALRRSARLPPYFGLIEALLARWISKRPR